MKNNMTNNSNSGDEINSMYSEVSIDALYSDRDNERIDQEPNVHDPLHKLSFMNTGEATKEWESPSDQLIGVIHLKSPFTSKINRGITHKGILAIGNKIVENERSKFLKSATDLINENDAIWNYILKHEKVILSKRVHDIYEKIFFKKCKTMSQEINKFYESTLQELEDHLKLEMQNVLVSAHAAVISDMNIKVREKMQKEKKIIQSTLKVRFESQVKKIKEYYKILLNYDLNRINKFINNKIVERNDALEAFYKQIEAENMTSTMYIMSTERRKCRIRKFILDKYQNKEVAEKLQTIKQRQDLLDKLKENEVCISDINNEWEEKIKKILRLFLKFISFALQLLPEQTIFLLDLEKMVVLQLNEIQKLPNNSSILIDEDEITNGFIFEDLVLKKVSCYKKPFIIEGDLSDPIPQKYEDNATLPSDVDLPTIRIDREYVYAKCHHFEEIKTVLESQICTCCDISTKEPSKASLPSESIASIKLNPSTTTKSSNETLLLEDIRRYDECPARLCNDWAKIITFPNLDYYLDFSDDNYLRVQTILDNENVEEITTELVNAKDIAHKSYPFGSTNYVNRHIGTQYSSQENICMPDIKCSCFEPHDAASLKTRNNLKEPNSKYFDDILRKRKTSLRRIIQENPKLLKMFTDEAFDFVI